MPRTYSVRRPGLRKGRVQPSKRVLRRLQAARDLESSIGVFGDDAAAGFGRRLAGGLAAGEAMPDQSLSLELVSRWVAAAGRELEERERDYCHRGRERSALGKRCRRAARKLYPRVVQLRRLLDSTYGDEDGFLVHGLSGKTRRKPQRLHDQVALLMARLRDPQYRLPEPLMKSTRVDREAWLGSVGPGYDRLHQLLGELQDRELEEVGARDRRDRELGTFDEVYGKALAYVKGVLGVAGFDRRAVRVLAPYAERRRLSRKARQERRARADGRRRSVSSGIRATVSAVSRWFGRRAG